MKVIFLDIDGVLNCEKIPNPRKFPYVVDTELLSRLTDLLERAHAKVVLSSTWRCDPVGLLAAQYWQIPFMDVCPDKPQSPRCDEILAWLADHPQVTRYAVIDDEDDELDHLALFQPSSRTGLTNDIVDAVECYLSGSTEQTMRANVITQWAKTLRRCSSATRAEEGRWNTYCDSLSAALRYQRFLFWEMFSDPRVLPASLVRPRRSRSPRSASPFGTIARTMSPWKGVP